MRPVFFIFSINRLGMGSFRVVPIVASNSRRFVIKNLLPAITIRGIAHSAYHCSEESLTPISMIWESAIAELNCFNENSLYGRLNIYL
jgi:hypothetical protein